MENLVNIDLDQNVVIPIPNGFTKLELASMVAIYKGYKEKVITPEKKEFIGTYDDLLLSEPDYKSGETLFIIQEFQEENGFKYHYQIIKEADNPVSILEFGIAQFIKPGGDLVREAIANHMLLDKKRELELASEYVGNVLTVLDDIKAT